MTAVRLLHRPDQADAWLRFGRPVREQRRGRHGVALFVPGDVFAYVDWRAGDYGTIHWNLAVLRAGQVGGRLTRWPGVCPGAELLLGARGKAAVARAFAAIDAIEAAGIAPEEVDPDHWRCVANWIATRSEPRPFDAAAHRAALARRALLG
jgi:hypothetical protein